MPSYDGGADDGLDRGGLLLIGGVTNPTDAVQSYRIYVAVTNNGATVGIDEVDVHAVASRATSDWSGSLGVGAEGATCVLRVERTQGA